MKDDILHDVRGLIISIECAVRDVERLAERCARVDLDDAGEHATDVQLDLVNALQGARQLQAALQATED